MNNAGVAPKVRADLLEATEESFEYVCAPISKVRTFSPKPSHAGWSSRSGPMPSFAAAIINVSSVSATVASVNRGDYCISKAGISMATQLWAARLGEFGIPVYEVRPGIIKTDMTAGVVAKYDKLICRGTAGRSRAGACPRTWAGPVRCWPAAI